MVNQLFNSRPFSIAIVQFPEGKLIYKWLNSMLYGRYNYSIHGDLKPTNITRGNHPVRNSFFKEGSTAKENGIRSN